MEAVIDSELCTGCGLCDEICPEVFEVDDGIAEVTVVSVPPNQEDDCISAMEACPVAAISLE